MSELREEIKMVEKDKASGMELYPCIANIVEVPSLTMSFKIDEETYDACNAYCEGKGRAKTIGRLIEKFIDDEFKPFAKPVASKNNINFKPLEKKLTVLVHEEYGDKIKAMAKKQNLHTTDYLRICLSAILVAKVKDYRED